MLSAVCLRHGLQLQHLIPLLIQTTDSDSHWSDSNLRSISSEFSQAAIFNKVNRAFVKKNGAVLGMLPTSSGKHISPFKHTSKYFFADFKMVSCCDTHQQKTYAI